MARIAREEHAAIRRRIDVDGEKVADVAAAYGCTPANIYAILAKVRRQDGPVPGAPAVSGTSREAGPAASPAPATDAPRDLFESPQPPQPAARTVPAAADTRTAPRKAATPGPAPPDPVAPAAVRPGAEARAAKAAPPSKPQARKPGYALLMRSSDGEEAVNPFRSLDDLLNAAKQILRTAARSPEPVWFSIQQVDLDTLDDGS